MTTQQLISDFMAQKRIAVVGVSRQEKVFSHGLFQALWKHGYDAVPVNPNTRECGGLPCVSRVQEIVPPVSAAMILTSGKHAPQAARDCVEAGISRIWVPLTTGKAPLSDADLSFLKDHGIEPIIGYCPYMFLPNSGFPHNFHGWIARLGKGYRAQA